LYDIIVIKKEKNAIQFSNVTATVHNHQISFKLVEKNYFEWGPIALPATLTMQSYGHASFLNMMLNKNNAYLPHTMQDAGQNWL